MKFLTNTGNPKSKETEMQFLPHAGETRAEGWARHLRRLSTRIIGDPQATVVYTVDELKAMDMVGVYSNAE